VLREGSRVNGKERLEIPDEPMQRERAKKRKPRLGEAGFSVGGEAWGRFNCKTREPAESSKENPQPDLAGKRICFIRELSARLVGRASRRDRHIRTSD
jgi:hypothetical protein